VARVAAGVVGAGVVVDGTKMIVAQGSYTTHIRWSLMYWEISILFLAFAS